MCPPGEAGENASQINLTEVNKQISEKWKTLSPAQRKDITSEAKQKIEEEREGRKLAAHSIPLNAFHDARSTIQSIETQVGHPQLISLAVLKLRSCRNCILGLVLNSCWSPVDQQLRTSSSHTPISQAMQLKASLARH